MARILVVDDDARVLTICRRFFQKSNAAGLTLAVDEASSGEEALALLESRAYDCVLSDFYMGAISGIDVLERVKRLQPSCVRLLMSFDADPVILQRAANRASIHDFIEKPIGAEAFEETLRLCVSEPFLPGGVAS